MIERTLATTVHGRFLFEERAPERLVVGFHGYGETAEVHLAELRQIPGIDRWSVASVQALHPFYTRSGKIVASWMTSLQREEAIEDNLAWVRQVLEQLPKPDTLVFTGFSQGAAMAARAASRISCAGLILLGGEIPPEISSDPGLILPPVLLARGDRDEWYTDEKFKKDLKYLESKTRVEPLVFDGGHEWTDVFRTAAARFLSTLAG